MNKIKTKKNSGIALISVLFIGLMILILVVTFSIAAMSENRATDANKTVIKLTELAEATSERARVKIYETFKDQLYTEKGFIDAIRVQLAGGASIPGLTGNHSTTVAGTNTRWEVRAVSDEDSPVSWIDIAATAENSKGSQTVVQRIGFSPSNIFELALLTETVNCMFCHLQVKGDVGTLKPFEPGWSMVFGGNDDDNAGRTSLVHGNLYAADMIVQDNRYTDIDGNPATVNGAVFTGTIEEHSRSRKLPKDLDGDGQADFPPIDRDKARKNADGSLWVNNQVGGALVKKIGWNEDLNNLNPGTGSLNSVTNGNVILVGTTANPINLDRDIFVEGDVIIKGVVTGQGAIYAGRNIYVAGNLTVKNKPDKPLEPGGVCAFIADPDMCAKANIIANKDTLRLGARGSIIMGDYTEFDQRTPRNNYGKFSNGQKKLSDRMPWSRTQNSSFFRNQFGFGWNDITDKITKKYYDIGHNQEAATGIAYGDEVEWREDLGAYVNVDNKIVDESQVLEVQANYTATTEVDGDDSYDYSFRPGHINTNGSFDSWVSDQMYRQVLGTENYDHNSWRKFINWSDDRDSSWQTDKLEFRKTFKLALEQSGLSISNSSLRNIWDARLTNRYHKIPIIDRNGQQIGYAHWGEGDEDVSSSSGGAMLRVMITANATYETQVTEVDAFLYANQRIAGKVSMKPIVINGGMIAKDVGVLAPGRVPDHEPWNLDSSTRNCDQEGDTYWVDGSEDCALTLNYDYRLRNGGFGFNLVATDTGKTLSWRLADSASDRVAK